MLARLYKPEDYPTVRAWFIAHGGQPVPASMLPRCGIVAESDGQPRAAAWLYQDNSVGMAWLAWMVSCPHQPLFHVEQALSCVLGAAERVARDLGYGVMLTMTEKPALGRWLRRQGFEANHEGMTQYFKPLT